MQSVLARIAPHAKQALVQQSRQMSVISSVPLVRISFAEKVAHGIVITVGCLAIPAWVLVNIKNYKGGH